MQLPFPASLLRGLLIPPRWVADSGSKSGKATGTGATEPEKPPHATVLLVDEVDIYDAPRFRYRLVAGLPRCRRQSGRRQSVRVA